MEFTLKTRIEAPAARIYQAWLDSNGHTEMTGGLAETSNSINSKFSAWDGYISGKTLILEENKRIVQSWRTTEFTSEEPDSRLEILFNEEGSTTELILNHSELPAHGTQYIEGWENHYFNPMIKYFESQA